MTGFFFADLAVELLVVVRDLGKDVVECFLFQLRVFMADPDAYLAVLLIFSMQ